MTRLSYDTDLTDDQWQILEPVIPVVKPGGRPRSLEMREVLNVIFYLLSNRIKWRAMPHELPKWQSVYTYLRARASGWHLAENQRWIAGHGAFTSRAECWTELPGVSIVNQSKQQVVGKTSVMNCGKKVKGRKRTILVDRMGLVLLESGSLSLHNISKKWTMPIRDWKDALNPFAIKFEGRFPPWIYP